MNKHKLRHKILTILYNNREAYNNDKENNKKSLSIKEIKGSISWVRLSQLQTEITILIRYKQVFEKYSSISHDRLTKHNLTYSINPDIGTITYLDKYNDELHAKSLRESWEHRLKVVAWSVAIVVGLLSIVSTIYQLHQNKKDLEALEQRIDKIEEQK